MSSPETEMDFEKTDKKTWLKEIIHEIGEPALENLEFMIDPDWGFLPFRHADDIEATSSIRGGNDRLSWQILECFGSLPEDNEIVLTSLKGGCETLLFEGGKKTAEHLPELLEGVHPGMVEMHFQSEIADELQAMLSALKQWIKPEGQAGKNLTGSIRWVHPEISGPSDIAVLRAHIRQLHDSFPGMKGICWDFPFSAYEEGLSPAMGKSFGAIVNVLDLIDSPDERRKMLEKSMIRVTIGQDYFREIIRLRAIRLLWYNLFRAHGLDDEGIHLEVHFHPGDYSPDAEKNMIRAGTKAQSAILGGADAVFILPADGNAATRDTRMRRIARNIHHLLRYESHLEKHTDPVKGAYFFASIVPRLVSKVWAQSIE